MWSEVKEEQWAPARCGGASPDARRPVDGLRLASARAAVPGHERNMAALAPDLVRSMSAGAHFHSRPVTAATRYSLRDLAGSPTAGTPLRSCPPSGLRPDSPFTSLRGAPAVAAHPIRQLATVNSRPPSANDLRPLRVKVLALRPVHALVGMGAEEVALGLQQIGR